MPTDLIVAHAEYVRRKRAMNHYFIDTPEARMEHRRDGFSRLGALAEEALEMSDRLARLVCVLGPWLRDMPPEVEYGKGTWSRHGIFVGGGYLQVYSVASIREAGKNPPRDPSGALHAVEWEIPCYGLTASQVEPISGIALSVESAQRACDETLMLVGYELRAS